MKKITRIVLVTLFWLLVWQLLALKVGEELLLPSPHRVLETLGKLIVTSEFWQSVFFSIVRVMIGILCALALGTSLAILTSKWKFLYDLFAPMITIVRSTPVASFILLLWLWLKAEKLPAVICLLMVLPIAWSAASDSIEAMDKQLLEVCKSYRFSFFKRLKLFYLPSFFPYFLSACKTSIGLAWKAGVAAETLVYSRYSIGSHLSDAKQYFETPDLFAWTLAVIVFSLLIESLTTIGLKKLGKHFGRKKHDGS